MEGSGWFSHAALVRRESVIGTRLPPRFLQPAPHKQSSYRLSGFVKGWRVAGRLCCRAASAPRLTQARGGGGFYPPTRLRPDCMGPVGDRYLALSNQHLGYQVLSWVPKTMLQVTDMNMVLHAIASKRGREKRKEANVRRNTRAEPEPAFHRGPASRRVGALLGTDRSIDWLSLLPPRPSMSLLGRLCAAGRFFFSPRQVLLCSTYSQLFGARCSRRGGSSSSLAATSGIKSHFSSHVAEAVRGAKAQPSRRKGRTTYYSILWNYRPCAMQASPDDDANRPSFSAAVPMTGGLSRRRRASRPGSKRGGEGPRRSSRHQQPAEVRPPLRCRQQRHHTRVLLPCHAPRHAMRELKGWTRVVEQDTRRRLGQARCSHRVCVAPA